MQVYPQKSLVDIGIQCTLPVSAGNTSDAGTQVGYISRPLAASSPRIIPSSCSESELSEVDDKMKEHDTSAGMYNESES